jgi:hypothetical protein
MVARFDSLSKKLYLDKVIVTFTITYASGVNQSMRRIIVASVKFGASSGFFQLLPIEYSYSIRVHEHGTEQ